MMDQAKGGASWQRFAGEPVDRIDAEQTVAGQSPACEPTLELSDTIRFFSLDLLESFR